MTPTKETVEAISETSVSQGNNRPKAGSDRMRSDAVSLEVPVKVHGTRVLDPTSATSQSEPFEEQASSMIVFPQGGVLKMATPVATGQMMVVTNLKSGHDAICRVIKVRAFGKNQSYVEIEFTHRQAGYWGVYFPSDGADAASQAAPVAPAPAAAPISVDIKVEKPAPQPAPEIVKPPAKPSSAPSKQESVFAQIGSQEAVQPAAAATSTRVRPSSIPEPAVKSPSTEMGKASGIDSLPIAPVSTAASISIGDLRGDAAPAISFAGAGVPGEVADAPAEEAVPRAEESAPLGRLAASATFGGSHSATREFGSGLSGSTLGIGTQSESNEKKGGFATIGLSVAALLAVAAGAAYYFHLPPFAAKNSAKTASPISAPAAPALAETISQTQQPNAMQSQSGAQEPDGSALNSAAKVNPAPMTAAPSAQVAANVPSVRANNIVASAPAKANKPAAAAPPTEAASEAPAPKSNAKVPDMFGALNAHPTSRSRSDSGAADAPSVDAPAPDGSAPGLTGIAGPAAIAAPAGESEAPVRIRVGGLLKPPRLISSVMPVYPAMARESGVQGDVVIDTTIDKTGKVTSTKVISGPSMLRLAALEALRQWKYEPSKLNGDPVPVQMTVTLKFHNQ